MHLSTAQVRRVDIIWGAAEARLKPKAGSGPRTEAISHVGAVQRAAAPELERFGKQLSTRQLQRLGEISIQSYGPDPLLYPGVAEQLHVSPRQLKRIQAEESVVRDRYLSSVVGKCGGVAEGLGPRHCKDCTGRSDGRAESGASQIARQAILDQVGRGLLR